MWRKCDLHRHTTPDNSGEFEFDPRTFVQGCVRDGLDVVGVTDHNRTDNIDAVIEEATKHDITVVPGVEIDTDRGHILALAPGAEGRIILDEFRNRVPFSDSGTVQFDRLTGALAEQRVAETSAFRNHVILVGAHADKVPAPYSVLVSLPLSATKSHMRRNCKRWRSSKSRLSKIGDEGSSNRTL